MEDLQDLVHLFWDDLTPAQREAFAGKKLVRGIMDLAFESPATIAERYRDAVAACATEYYGVRLTPDQAGAVILTDHRLRRELCVTYGRRPSAETGFDTADRELIGQAVVDYLMPGRPEHPDEALRLADRETWHWPINASDDAYAAEFYRRFQASATAAGVALVEEFWVD